MASANPNETAEDDQLWPEPKFTQQYVTCISHLLTKNGIPNVLWGNFLLAIYWVPVGSNTIEFIVPDDLLEATASVIRDKKLQLGLSDCSDLETCNEMVGDLELPPPALHFHFSYDNLAVLIHKQSKTLWFMPRLQLSPDTSSSSPDFLLASDSRLPPSAIIRGGRYEADNPPMYIPSAHRALEAYTRLLVRWIDHDQYSSGYMGIICYFGLYTHDAGYLDLESLESRCRKYFLRKLTPEKPLRKHLSDLVASFEGSND